MSAIEVRHVLHDCERATGAPGRKCCCTRTAAVATGARFVVRRAEDDRELVYRAELYPHDGRVFELFRLATGRP